MSDRIISTADLSRIEGNLNVLARGQDQLAGLVEVVRTEQSEIDNRVQLLAATFDAYVEADRRSKELQLAETRIVKIRQELDAEFGHYGDVRRRATGILQALDAGLVTHETVRETTEDVMMAAPRYWLAPALVALAAWSRDDRPLAEKGLAEALRRDGDKTALFYALVLRRFGRRAPAARWLSYFFSRQDPTALRREFVVILDAVATGAFGSEAQQLVGGNVSEWMSDLTARTGFVDDQRSRWQEALVALTPAVGDDAYPQLARLSSTWAQLKTSLGAVRRNAPIEQHFAAIFEGELQVPRNLQVQIDDLLDSLVANFDAEELPLRHEEARLQAIIDFGGDIAQAEMRFESTQRALVETVDFPGLLTNAAMNATEAGASAGTQRLAVAMSRDWILDAHERLTAATRSAVPSRIDLELNGWSGAIEDGTSDDALLASLGEHMQRLTEQAVATVKFRGAPLFAAIAAPVVLIVGLATGPNPVLIIGALIAAVYAWTGYRGLEGKRRAARTAGDEEKARAEETLRGTLVEVVDFREEWNRCDAQSEEVRQLLASISVSHYTLARDDDARTVLQ